jgi:hypothetical protein
MADQNDVRAIALSLPETTEDEGHFAFSVNNRGKRKGFAWVWMERVHPKKPRVANPGVIAVMVCDIQEREMLLAAYPLKYFTEPHYRGFPAVLVRLAEVGVDELRDLLTNAWRCQAPPALVRDFDSSMGGRRFPLPSE